MSDWPVAVTLFCLHFLGGSARSWADVGQALAPAIDCVALDLPGFGDAGDEGGASVAAMANRIADRIRGASARRWWLAGHSMGAKVALAVARKAEVGSEGLEGLAGLALLAGSPPTPEPMDERKRAEMLAWIDGPEALRQEKARAYIRANVNEPLSSTAEDHAVADVLRANPGAWKEWLTTGSRENLRETIGRLAIPALILSGVDDAALGPEAQERLMMPHFADSRHIPLAGTGHLLPIERPGLIAKHLRDVIIPRH